MGLIIGLLLAFIAGLAMIEMGFTDPEFTIGSRIFMIICGIIMALPGPMILLPSLLSKVNRTKEKNTSGKPGLKNLLLSLLSHIKFLVFLTREPDTEDDNPVRRHLSSFRAAYSEFFVSPRVPENAPLQQEATQIYWHILALQKRRLEKRSLTMEFQSARMRYGDFPSVAGRNYFDGKYEITEMSETLEASKIFKAGEQILGKDTCTQVARFRLLDAKKQGPTKIVCPNCGNLSTRENLLDGCDFCGTKFTIEDLGMRVSDFSFRPDYEIEYAKYKDARSRFSLWVGLLIGIPVAILSIIGAIGAILGGAADGTGPFMKICACVLTVAFCTFAAVYLSLCFFYFCIFPFVQLVASSVHVAKKRMNVLKTQEQIDSRLEAQIRQNDPLFSVAGFYSAMQNKLSTIFYGETEPELCAFAEGAEAEQAILAIKDTFKDVINVETDWLRIAAFRINGTQAEIIAEAMLTFTHEYADKLQHRSRLIRCKVVRDASCHTQSVSAPSLLTCESCGAPLSFLEGKTCAHCGSIRRISKFDWAIAEYGMQNK